MKVYTGSAWVVAYVSGGNPVFGYTVITDNSANNALRITQMGAGNALLVEDSANPDVSPFVIDAGGFVIAGAQTAISASGGAPKLQSHVLGSQSLGAFAWADTANATSVSISKSRGTSVGSYTVVQSGDDLGSLRFEGSDGTGFIRAAQINASVDGTPGTNDMPDRLVFSTTADGASAPTERMRLDSNGRLTLKKSSNAEITALTDGATITPDFSLANNYSVTLGGNRTLANPTNLTAGQSGAIVITQDGTGSRTLAYGSYWKFPGGTAPTLTTTASAVDVLVYYVESATRITARLLSDVK
jgi:hypothetical protein